MYEKLKEIFMILPLVLLLLLVMSLTKTGSIKKSLALQIPENIGMNSDLKEQIDSLELDITRRMNYEVEISRDPLKLNNILKLKGFNGSKEFKEKQQELRLSCTIISPTTKKAVIKHRSKSYVLSEGGIISGYTVKKIEKKRVLLSRNGKEITLINKPAPVREKIQDKNRSDKEIKL